MCSNMVQDTKFTYKIYSVSTEGLFYGCRQYGVSYCLKSVLLGFNECVCWSVGLCTRSLSLSVSLSLSLFISLSFNFLVFWSLLSFFSPFHTLPLSPPPPPPSSQPPFFLTPYSHVTMCFCYMFVCTHSIDSGNQLSSHRVLEVDV